MAHAKKKSGSTCDHVTRASQVDLHMKGEDSLRHRYSHWFGELPEGLCNARGWKKPAVDMDPPVGPSPQEAGCRLAYVYITGSLNREEQIPVDLGDCERTQSHEHASTSGPCNGVEGNVLHSVRGARYTAALLKSTLMLMGCKPRVAHKVQLCAGCTTV